MSTPTNLLLVIAAAAVLSGAVRAQLSRGATSPEEQLRQQIAELHTETGLARPAALVDPLRALAILYREQGDHALASATLEEARFVTRIHHGLTSAEEALLLRQQIRSEKALGNDQRAFDFEQDMVMIARHNHDDVRMTPIFRELAEDRSEVLSQVHAGKRPPIVYIGCYYSAARPRYEDPRGERGPPEQNAIQGIDPLPPSCLGGVPGAIVTRLRHEILMYYADAIETLLKAGDYASQELRDLENAALGVAGGYGGGVQTGEAGGPFVICSGGTLDGYLTLEILDSCLAPVGRGNKLVVANVGNSAALIRLISYEIRSAAPAADRADAVARLADWHVFMVPADRRRFDLSPAAFALYERAYRELRSSADRRASTLMFAPELPVTLPTFRRNPLATAATESSRYIDVSFDVTKYGRGERIEILATSNDATREETRGLIRLIESTTFRPRFVDGELADAAPVALRYYLP